MQNTFCNRCIFAMMKHTRLLLSIFILLAGLMTFQACQEDNFNMDGSLSLEFSVDTLRFDTVFTTLGSATRTIKAYNRSNDPILISEVFLAEGSLSKFRINVDGITIEPGAKATDIPIAANDSVYIFAEVTINPDDPLESSPFVLYEDLLFETNGNMQNVTLEAFGQNANYVPSQFSAGTVNLLTCDMGIETWNDPRPYVIYGVLVVDSCEIVVPQGTDIYVHGGLVNSGDTLFYNDGIWFFGNEGKLTINGALNNPVTIQGDRLEEPFQEVQGQWGGIRLSTGNRLHEINYAVIKNSIVGVRVDSAATLNIQNTQILNTSNSGLLGVHANITGSNLLVADNASFAAQFEYGGNYDFTYCTFTNFGADAAAVRFSNALCLDALCGNCRGNDLNATLTNCIAVGSRNDELSFFDRDCNGEAFNVNLNNCVIRVADLLDDYPNFFSDNCDPGTCYNWDPSDPLFEDRNDGDFHLDSLSFAEEKAIPILGLSLDLDGEMRDGTMPDVGCFESTY